MQVSYRRKWMLAGFAAAFLVGDLFLTLLKAGSDMDSTGYVIGVAGFALAQVFWTIGQLREARPDLRVALALAIPLATFALVRLRPPVMPSAANVAVAVYSLLTALSFATALATRRVFYICGIGLLLFSDMMIGGSLLGVPGCNSLIRDTYLAAMAFVLVSFCLKREWRIPTERISVRWYALSVAAVGFTCFVVAMTQYPGGGYNPLLQMLSALGETKVRDVVYTSCHYWFMAGMFLSAASVAGVWASLACEIGGGWRRILVGWGGALNAAGLCTIALVPFDVNGTIHNVGCYLATSGGALILIARFRKGPDLAWTCWLVLLVIVFALCIDLDAIPFSPYVTTTQKLLIVSFAAWAGWVACLAGMRRKDASHPCSQSLRAAACGLDCEIRQQRKKMTTRNEFRKLMLAAATVAFVAFVHATDMEHKARIVATVATENAGTAEVTCNEPGGWKFDVSASQDSGRDVVTVRLTSEVAAHPPRFGLYVRMSGAGVRNVWTSDYTRDGCHLWPKLWWDANSKHVSQLAYETPVVVGLDSCERSPVAMACSEAFSPLEFGLYADDSTCEIVCRCEFFTAPSIEMREYEVSVLLDRRGLYFADVVRQCSEWIALKNEFVSASVPETAFDPLYSTWYAYLQDVRADVLEKDALLASELGMKTMILDDGWQKVDSRTFYSATGDWMPVPSRFPDMKAHVAAVHNAGLKYMLWLAVPYVGDESKAWKRFKDKSLLIRGSKSPGRIAVLDPRFPEVREYLISTYERVVGEWDFDGVKLDFIDQFVQPSADPAAKDNYAGRDYRSVPEAVNRLMKDVLARLRAIKPDVLVEFRQHYMGPAILQYGNMMRAADCPADLTANRRRICDLRLTSGDIAVHSDMLVWSRDESPEGAALPILNVLFSTIQYSMALSNIHPAHREVIRSWLGFSQRHRKALLRGAFRPHHAENGYTWIEGESEEERVVAVYANDVCVRTGAADRPVFLVNATGGRGMLAEFAADARVEFFDVFGKPAGTASVAKGLIRLDVPASGFAKVTWQ